MPFFILLALLTVSSASAQEGPWSIVLAPAEEPGEPLVVTGTVYGPDGRTPLKGISVYVYHADNDGYYRKGTLSSRDPRLHGTMITNAQGRYEFRTIKPKGYQNRPAHIHFVITGRGYEKLDVELQFDGDPRLGGERGADSFSIIQPLERDKNEVWRCTRDFKLTPR